MLKLSDLGDHNSCIDKIGMSFVESWFLKILVAEKTLIQTGDFKKPEDIQRVKNIYDGDDKIVISGTIKTGWLSSNKEFSVEVPSTQFDKFLDASFPLTGADKTRFKTIKSKYLKYLSKEDQLKYAD